MRRFYRCLCLSLRVIYYIPIIVMEIAEQTSSPESSVPVNQGINNMQLTLTNVNIALENLKSGMNKVSTTVSHEKRQMVTKEMPVLVENIITILDEVSTFIDEINVLPAPEKAEKPTT